MSRKGQKTRLEGFNYFQMFFSKAALSPQLLKDLEYRSGRVLNQRPPARQTGAHQTKLTGWRSAWKTDRRSGKSLVSKVAINFPFSCFQLN